MTLLAKDEDEPGIHEWIVKTRASMTKEEINNHALAIMGFHYALLPEEGQITFPAYLNQLEKMDATALRDKMLNIYANLWQDTPSDVAWDEVLISSENYIKFLLTRFSEEAVDMNIEKQAYELIIDPPAMKEFLVGHMNWIWETHFKAEWKRIEPMLRESIRSFKKIDLLNMSRSEAAIYITGQDVSNAKWCKKIDMVERVIFIPNPHIGPYVFSKVFDNVMQVVFGARQPEGTGTRIPDLDRTEIVARLSALADDTRMHILQLVAERGEIRVHDILEVINLSQPSVSRYLSQLTASGYLQERRESGAKVYILNHDRIEKTLKAVSAFLSGR
jgi:DNA-binding transcriptional ArsR family regulator